MDHPCTIFGPSWDNPWAILGPCRPGWPAPSRIADRSITCDEYAYRRCFCRPRQLRSSTLYKRIDPRHSFIKITKWRSMGRGPYRVSQPGDAIGPCFPVHRPLQFNQLTRFGPPDGDGNRFARPRLPPMIFLPSPNPRGSHGRYGHLEARVSEYASRHIKNYATAGF